jgi:hypothetical protein
LPMERTSMSKANHKARAPFARSSAHAAKVQKALIRHIEKQIAARR